MRDAMQAVTKYSIVFINNSSNTDYVFGLKVGSTVIDPPNILKIYSVEDKNHSCCKPRVRVFGQSQAEK